MEPNAYSPSELLLPSVIVIGAAHLEINMSTPPLSFCKMLSSVDHSQVLSLLAICYYFIMLPSFLLETVNAFLLKLRI